MHRTPDIRPRVTSAMRYFGYYNISYVLVRVTYNAIN